MIEFTRVEYRPTGSPKHGFTHFQDIGPVMIAPEHVVAVMPYRDGDRTIKGACILITTNDNWRATVHGAVEYVRNQIEAANAESALGALAKCINTNDDTDDPPAEWPNAYT